MFKRNAAVRITAYLLTGMALWVGGSVGIALLTTWLIPYPISMAVSGLLGLVWGFAFTTFLFTRYINKYSKYPGVPFFDTFAEMVAAFPPSMPEV